MIFILLLFLNSFVWNILNNYGMIIFALIMLILFKCFFGFEKDRHRYVKDIIFDIFIIILISFLSYYLMGIYIGFYRVGNFYDWYGLKTFILPTFLMIIVKEFLRYQMLTKSDGNMFLIIINIFLFVLMDVSNSLYYDNFSSVLDVFKLVALTLLPSVSRNIVCSYISLKFGYKPNYVWCLILGLYQYLLPIIPNPNEYFLSILILLLPIFIFFRVYGFVSKASDFEIEREYNNKNIFVMIVPIVLIGLVFYYTSGYFKYYAVAIASGSMSPYINKGDIVVIDKIKEDYSKIKVDQVLAYEYNNVLVVHRIVNIIYDNGEYYFYTKGDSNNNKDNYVIKEEMIKGIVKYRIPYIGLPTVWINQY